MKVKVNVKEKVGMKVKVKVDVMPTPEPGVGQEEVRGGSIGRGALPGQTGIYVLLKY